MAIKLSNKLKRKVEKVISFDTYMSSLSDDKLKAKTVEFQERYRKGESLDKLLPEAFAAASEAAYRVLGMKPYPVQIAGGIVLHEGKIAEMKTGEGKTLVSIMPAYLHALTGDGVHVVTVNDYLANRDSSIMGQVHEFMGLSVGCVIADMPTEQRQHAYKCDITYITNNELGFDYLRDNLATDAKNCVQRGLHFVIMDEVDSVLIDEARTPLIISGMSGKSTKLYGLCNHLAGNLEKGESSGELTKLDIINKVEQTETGDFIVHEKEQTIHITEQGARRIEHFFNLSNLADVENAEISHHMHVALKAHHLMHRDKDYVVNDSGVVIVDEFTGRIMDGRRYSDGLHQALEAKEGIDVQQESQTFATITFQNFFNKYDLKCGMTGTAQTEAKEFDMTYGLKTVQIPTNKPVKRVDEQDSLYQTRNAKYDAIVHEVVKRHKTGQPILVGTTTIEVSELLSNMLKKANISHQVLNAKVPDKEAQIIADAGLHGAVTIATNMAGRGTDIKLDDEARNAGGLYIIGTEKHESRRIDNQLRGRAGRQGDPGGSKFYISLEDDVLRLFGGDKMQTVCANMGVAEDAEVVHPFVHRFVLKAQEKIEANYYGMRKMLLDFDAVNDQQRELLYAERTAVLTEDNMGRFMEELQDDVITDLVNTHCVGSRNSWNDAAIAKAYNQLLPTPYQCEISFTDVKNKRQMRDTLLTALSRTFDKHEATLDATVMQAVERNVLLRMIDRKWMEHLTNMEQLRQGISLIGYGQKEPVLIYKTEAFALFEHMLGDIQRCTLRTVLSAKMTVQTA